MNSLRWAACFLACATFSCVVAEDAKLDEGNGGCTGNMCGGCELLEGKPGDACGICGGGVLACAQPEALACVGANRVNGCGGCDVLDGPPGGDCGPCGDGAWVCSGDNAVTCGPGDNNNDGTPDPGTPIAGNICGGCGPVNGVIGDSCGFCGGGELGCSGTTLACLNATPTNSCGGCAALGHVSWDACENCSAPQGNLFDPCGPCGEGRWQCTDADTLTCDSPKPPGNICLGCAPLLEVVGAACGVCGDGLLACSDRAMVCDGATPTNACGGCATLSHDINEVCGVCNDGAYQCDGAEDVVCTGFTPANACGGCGPLPETLDGSCGNCGIWVCDAEVVGAVRCGGPTANLCGGCNTIAVDPGTDCAGICGSYTCATDGESTSCVDPGLNACGGCGELTATPLESCGTCGQMVCSADKSSVSCVDPGLNGCNVCAALDSAPGAACPTCGYFACETGGTSTLCDERECPGPLTGARVINVALHDVSCSSAADCGPGEACINADGAGGVDTCAPVFEMRLGSADLDYPDYSFQGTTEYRADFAGAHNLFAWRRDAGRVGNPMWTHNFNLIAPAEATFLIGNRRESATICGGDFDCPTGTCVGTTCVNYQVFSIQDDNTPVPDLVKLRLINGHSDYVAIDLVDDAGGASRQLINDVMYGSASDYITVQPGAFRFIVNAGDDSVIGTYPSETLLGGQVRTVLFFGRPGSDVHLAATLNDRTW